MRKSQAQNYNSKEEKKLKDSANLLNSDLFEKPIDIYTESGRLHPPFEIINKQLEVSLYRITNKNNKVGIGFFCAIPFPTFHDWLPVLIINNYVLEKNEISPGKK